MINHDKNLKKNISKPQDPRQIQSFIEEFSWLLSMYSNLDFKSMPEVIKNSFLPSSSPSKAMLGYVSSNPNKQFLTGVLPGFFNDKSIFTSAEDIAQFAKSVLKLELLHYEKKSRYELIGTIVCKTINLSDNELAELVKALSLLLSKSTKAKNIVSQRKKQLYGWNAIIQELAKESSNE